MPITQSPTGEAWYLETPNTLYVVSLSELRVPAQRYWGPLLPASDWPQLAEPLRSRSLHSHGSRPSEVEEEVTPSGGSRWGVSGLNVVLEGADRAPELAFATARISQSDAAAELALDLLDSQGALTVTLHYRVRADSDVIERWSSLALAGTASVAAEIHRLDSANWFVEDQHDYRYSAVNGYWAGETQLERGPLPTGELTFTSRSGFTGHAANPWIMLDDGSTTESHGRVRTVALGWSGTWRLTTQRRAEGGVSVSAGFGHEGIVLRLAPGTTLSTPASFGLVSDGGFGGASRGWHAFARGFLRPSGQELNPVLYNSWEATEFDVTEEGQRGLADVAARLGVELFVVDDGWFSTRTNDRSGLGDWAPNPERFPHGLHGLRSHVTGLGMKFGLWVEPEMVNPDSALYRAHPDWVLHVEGRARAERRNQLILNFARTDVQEWAFGWLDELAGEYQLDFMKWDMNRPFTQAGWPSNAREQDSLWVLHTRGIYELMAKLRAAHPRLRIESCAGGGGRIDLGIMALTDQFWTSDNTDAIDRQAIQHGFSQLYPAIGMTSWVTDSPNPLTFREVPLEYRFHVAMAGMLGIGGNLKNWSDAELAQAAALVEQYKGIREVVQLGEQYRLGGVPGFERSAVHYVHGGRVVVFCYEPRRSLDRGTRNITLPGLEPQAVYRVLGAGPLAGQEHSGAYLATRGLPFHESEHVIEATGSLRFSQRDFISSITELVRR